jgi:hypothetical protein
MPDRYRREVERIIAAGTLPGRRDIREIAGDLEMLAQEAEAGEHGSLAYLIRMALAEARRLAERSGEVG